MKLFKFFPILFCYILNVNACWSNSASNSASGVIGGTEADINHFPFIGAIIKPGYCGCSIINRNFALTASHCTYKGGIGKALTPDEFRIRFGSADRTSGGIISEVSALTRHFKHNSKTKENDLAILKLYESLDFSPTIQPIPLVDDDYDATSGVDAWIVGWGVQNAASLENSDTIPDFPHKLQYGKISIYEFSRCKKFYEENTSNVITNRMICAGTSDKGIGICKGDSGGPLVIKRGEQFHLVGVASFVSLMKTLILRQFYYFLMFIIKLGWRMCKKTFSRGFCSCGFSS